MMTFSIIIPAYNYAHVLPRAIDAARQQEGDDFEVIVINDGSTDNTAEILQHYENQQLSNLRLITQTNKGAAAARNRGIGSAQGAYLIFPDADDELLPCALRELRHAVAKYPDVAMWIAGYNRCDSEGHIRSSQLPPRLSRKSEKNFLNYIHEKFNLANGAVLFKKTVFAQIRYPEHLPSVEDLSVFAQALASYPCQSLAVPIINIYKHGDSMRHDITRHEKAYPHLADALFNPACLPTKYMRYKSVYIARQRLHYFRRLYRTKQYAAARRLYWQTVCDHPRAWLWWRNLRKFLKILPVQQSETNH